MSRHALFEPAAGLCLVIQTLATDICHRQLKSNFQVARRPSGWRAGFYANERAPRDIEFCLKFCTEIDFKSFPTKSNGGCQGAVF